MNGRLVSSGFYRRVKVTSFSRHDVLVFCWTVIALCIYERKKNINSVILLFAGRVGASLQIEISQPLFLGRKMQCLHSMGWAAKEANVERMVVVLIHLACIPSTDISHFQKMHFLLNFEPTSWFMLQRSSSTVCVHAYTFQYPNGTLFNSGYSE